jgi:hypothetical protein
VGEPVTAPERKVVERKVLAENDGWKEPPSEVFLCPVGWRLVAERLEEEPSEFEKAARSIETTHDHGDVGCTEVPCPILNVVRLLRDADRRLREVKP